MFRFTMSEMTIFVLTTSRHDCVVYLGRIDIRKTYARYRDKNYRAETVSLFDENTEVEEILARRITVSEELVSEQHLKELDEMQVLRGGL